MKEGSIASRISPLIKRKGFTVSELIEALELNVSTPRRASRAYTAVYQALRRLGAKKASSVEKETPCRGPAPSRYTLRGV